jgi:hypothetical protein
MNSSHVTARRSPCPATGALNRVELSRDLGNLVEDPVRLPTVIVAVHRDEHAGRDLPESIQHAGDAEVG